MLRVLFPPLPVRALFVCASCRVPATPGFLTSDTHCPHSVTVNEPNETPRTSKAVHYAPPWGAPTPLRNGIGYK
ncbi:hypothetical protein EYF80_035276 [Liparis tanakae]|uniref:Uncharacterized protein n=1 Tax=Liparis tanakae TaxID=230148 RepID=A0A4Z2GMP3_9TELE|nr:hypothetical protein EYF80_035276 [Liparis tanakae]